MDKRVSTRVRLGRIVATPAALDLLNMHHQLAESLLKRHACGDWGDISACDREENNQALLQQRRLLSSYHVGDQAVWIITEADRSSTCVLLPSEY